jgi:hypothetical protein
MKQSVLFKGAELQDENIKSIGHRLYLKFTDTTPAKAALYHNDTMVKIIELSDKVAKKLLVVEAVEMGAGKRRWRQHLVSPARRCIIMLK